ncbi:cytadherence high molecular weight protein 2-like [Atheta coriaria]|uniref:cytadherence high molecular weight protein 2-like n=1 Tax=Dalotia coriaria TaxID=877792 RepID=UPI0031F34CAB
MESSFLLEEQVRDLESKLSYSSQTIKTKEHVVRLQQEQIKKLETMYKKSLEDIARVSCEYKQAQNELENLRIILKSVRTTMKRAKKSTQNMELQVDLKPPVCIEDFQHEYMKQFNEINNIIGLQTEKNQYIIELLQEVTSNHLCAILQRVEELATNTENLTVRKVQILPILVENVEEVKDNMCLMIEANHQTDLITVDSSTNITINVSSSPVQAVTATMNVGSSPEEISLHTCSIQCELNTYSSILIQNTVYDDICILKSSLQRIEADVDVNEELFEHLKQLMLTCQHLVEYIYQKDNEIASLRTNVDVISSMLERTSVLAIDEVKQLCKDVTLQTGQEYMRIMQENGRVKVHNEMLTTEIEELKNHTCEYPRIVVELMNVNTQTELEFYQDVYTFKSFKMPMMVSCSTQIYNWAGITDQIQLLRLENDELIKRIIDLKEELHLAQFNHIAMKELQEMCLKLSQDSNQEHYHQAIQELQLEIYNLRADNKQLSDGVKQLRIVVHAHDELMRENNIDDSSLSELKELKCMCQELTVSLKHKTQLPPIEEKFEVLVNLEKDLRVLMKEFLEFKWSSQIEHEKLLLKHSDLLTHNEELINCLNQYRSVNGSLLQSHYDLEIAKCNVDNENQRLLAEIVSFTSTISKSSESCGINTDLTIEDIVELNQVKRDNCKLQQEMDNVLKQINTLETLNMNFEKINSENNQLKAAITEKDNTLSSYNNLKEQFRHLQLHTDENIEKYRHEAEILKNAISKLEIETNTFKSELEQKEKIIKDNNSLQNELEDLQIQLKAVTDVKDKVEADFESYIRTNNLLQQTIHAQDIGIAEDLSETKEQNEALRSQLNDVLYNQANTESEFAQITNECANYKLQLDKMAHKMAVHTQEHLAYKTDAEEVKQGLLMEIARLKQMLQCPDAFDVNDYQGEDGARKLKAFINAKDLEIDRLMGQKMRAMEMMGRGRDTFKVQLNPKKCSRDLSASAGSCSSKRGHPRSASVPRTAKQAVPNWSKQNNSTKWK